MKRPTVISLYDQSAVALRPWAAMGCRCIAIDIAGGNARLARNAVVDHGIERIAADVRLLPFQPGGADVVMAWPPCTDLASVGAGAWERKGDAALLDALSMVDAAMRFILMHRPAIWWIENPHGRLSRYIGPPSHTFQPCDYGGWLKDGGDNYTKQTCLWTSDSFSMPPTRPVTLRGCLIDMTASKTLRSRTPAGFAFAAAVTNARTLGLDAAPLGVVSNDQSVMHWLRVENQCACCARPMPARNGRRFCSTRCRVAAHREKQRQGVQTPHTS